MGMPPETDKVWPHTGVIVCSCDIQSDPHESESELLRILIHIFIRFSKNIDKIIYL